MKVPGNIRRQTARSAHSTDLAALHRHGIVQFQRWESLENADNMDEDDGDL